ncbi:hypothetical protein HTZ77_35155 [Nonomuraea sp. SMC257]|uniref:TOMM leader peptide-binding protein n=1 Tax=Nonomuraea montanisoli TaxID=2741721 RepID=A0A7Y6IGU6_9ACTN|nr:hypothetical protein [Nonomuraea montanisoli]NUW36609.1 hypothetical protein [Nonomuraea montanisoli]
MNTDSPMDARRISVAMAKDPQLSLPERLKVADGLVLADMGDGGLLVEGTPTPQLFGGRHVPFTRRLLQALDGERTHAEVAALLGLPDSRTVETALALLYSCGVLECGGDPGGVDLLRQTSVPRHVVTYLSRNVSSTRNRPSGVRAALGLATTPTLVLGRPSALRSALAGALTADGVASVAERGLDEAGEPAPSSIAVVLDDGTMDLDGLVPFDDRVRAGSGRWFLVSLTGTQARISPVFENGWSGCLHCYRAQQSLPRTRAAAELPPWRSDLLAGLLGNQVCRLASGVQELHGESAVTVLDFETWTCEEEMFVQLPGCSMCLPGTKPLEEDDLAVVAFEQEVTQPPRRYIANSTHQKHYSMANVELAFLDRVRDWPVAESADPDLLALLHHSFGVREVLSGSPDRPPARRRWAPTGGNLGSPTAFLLPAAGNGLALDPVVHVYDGVTNTLLRGLTDVGAEHIGEVVSLPGAPLDALVVLTGDAFKLMEKYHNFGYKIVNEDGGVATWQLARLAQDMGVTVTAADTWNDGLLTDLLDVDPRQTPITAVLALGRGERDAAGLEAARRAADATGLGGRAVSSGDAAPARAGAPFRVREIVKELIERSHAPGHGGTCFTEDPVGSSGPGIPVPPAGPPVVEPMEFLNRRQSTRFFGTDGISQEAMAGVLRAPAAARQALATGPLVPGIRLLAAVYAVEGLAPGLYEARPDGSALHPLAELPPAREWLLQDEFADGALITVVTCDLPQVARAGSHAHRLVLHQAGVAAHSMWLAAGELGLVGSIFGGLVPWGVPLPEFRPGGRHSPLLGFACGTPLGDAAGKWGMAGG